MVESIRLREAPLKWMQRHLQSNYGIYFPEKKLYSLKSKLERRYRKLGLESLEDYARHLGDTPDEVPYFLDAVTTNKTRFFRGPDHWDFFRDLIEGEHWIGPGEELRVWSAACSSGEEPYSIGMILENLGVNFSYRILASDISEKIIRVGSRGIYSNQSMNQVRDFNPQFVNRYFERTSEDNFQVDDSLRRQIYFRQFNLKFHSNPFEKSFDVIFLRNVLIYFKDDLIEKVIAECHDLLRSGGILLIGQAENIGGISHPLTKVEPSIFMKD